MENDTIMTPIEINNFEVMLFIIFPKQKLIPNPQKHTSAFDIQGNDNNDKAYTKLCCKTTVVVNSADALTIL
jgi:hypothetical protein